VLCPEQGGWVGPGDYPCDKPEWEAACPPEVDPDPNVRGLDADYPCDSYEADCTLNMFLRRGRQLDHLTALASDAAFRLR